MRPTLLTTNATHLRMRRAAEYELMDSCRSCQSGQTEKASDGILSGSSLPEVFSAAIGILGWGAIVTGLRRFYSSTYSSDLLQICE